MNDELIHYGVLGMKWGKRKKQDVATRSDRKNKLESPDLRKAKALLGEKTKEYSDVVKKYNKDMGIKGYTDYETQKAYNKAQREIGYIKQDISMEKTLAKIKMKEKSQKQLALEADYKAKGMNDKEAAVAAYKNIRTRQMIAGLAVGATAVGVAYGANKIRNEYVDKIIKSGTIFQHMSADSSASVRDAFYSTDNILDNIKYKGMFGQHLARQDKESYVKSVKTLSDIKQVSPNNAKKILNDIISNDSNFKDNLMTYMNDNGLPFNGSLANRKETIRKDLAKGKITKDVYDAFNVALVDHSPEMQKLTDKFYNELSKKGYNAIKDVNDAKYSGFNALNPLITFNSSGKVQVKDVKKLTQEQIDRNSKLVMSSRAAKELAKGGAIYVAGMSAALGVGKAVDNKSRERLVADYRKKNPNTKLSYNEIYRMLERKEEE